MFNYENRFSRKKGSVIVIHLYHKYKISNRKVDSGAGAEWANGIPQCPCPS